MHKFRQISQNLKEILGLKNFAKLKFCITLMNEKWSWLTWFLKIWYSNIIWELTFYLGWRTNFWIFSIFKESKEEGGRRQGCTLYDDYLFGSWHLWKIKKFQNNTYMQLPILLGDLWGPPVGDRVKDRSRKYGTHKYLVNFRALFLTLFEDSIYA